MILFFAGTPGIGKTTLAQALPALVFSLDDYRAKTGVTSTTNPLVEDAVNWQVFCAVAQALRAEPSRLTIVDSTGTSRRLPFLRYALGEYPQRLVRLNGSFAYANCTRKWGQAYSLDQFQRLEGKVRDLHADIDLRVDGKTPPDLAQELLSQL